MIINPLDAHDRLQHFTKQSSDIGECCQDLINKRPFGDYPFYIFAHPRTADDGVTKLMIWQPRLTKPKSQTNSMLFKAYPGTDIVKIIWIIPPREMWKQYEKGKLTENKFISESIHDFENNRAKLEQKEEDDLPDEKIDQIYKEISFAARNAKGKTALV
jgi:hypothetical protein